METYPEMMDNLSKSIFQEIYPLIARQIVEKCGIKEGIGVDIGSGSGSLAIALAKITDLEIYSLDISDKMNLIARQNVENVKLSHRIFPVIADVHVLPFSDEFAELIVSRGSMFFWKDLTQCFREINRALKPSGYAYIGGGFGSAELKEKIKKSNKESNNPEHVKIPKISVLDLQKNLNYAQIKNYEIINDDSGLWVLITK